MKNKTAVMAAVIFTALSISVKARADENSTALPFLRIDQNSESVAMGSVSLWANPASAVLTEKRGHAMAGYQKWSLTSSDFISLDAAYKIGDRLAVKAAFTNQNEAPYDLTDEYGQPAGQFTPGAMKASAGMSVRINEWLSAGADLGYGSRTLAQGASYGAFYADVAVMAKTRYISAAAGARCIGSGVKTLDGSSSFSLPASAFLSAGHEFILGDMHSISAALDLEYFFYGSAAVSAGARYSFKNMLSVMGGYHIGGIIADHASVGLGLSIKGMCLNASCLLGQGGIGGTMLFGVGYRF